MRLSRIHQIALRADELDASVAFYRDVLGATFMARFDPPGLAFFDFEGVRLMLDRNAAPGTVYFHVRMSTRRPGNSPTAVSPSTSDRR